MLYSPASPPLLIAQAQWGQAVSDCRAPMNDLIRPALYQAHREILPLRESLAEAAPLDVEGPICEFGDFYAKDCPLTPLDSGDIIDRRSPWFRPGF